MRLHCCSSLEQTEGSEASGKEMVDKKSTDSSLLTFREQDV